MSPLRGIALKLASICVFMVMVSLIKASSDYVPPGQAVFFRSFFAMPVIVMWLAYRHELHTGLKTRNPMGHVWRGLIGTSSMGLSFAGLGLLPLPEVTAIGYASPILVVVFAAMFLGEQVRLFRLSMVALGMAGVLVILSPRLQIDPTAAGTQDALGAILVLMSAVFGALAQVFVRRMVATETTAAIVFYFSVTASLMALLTLPWGWTWPPVPVIGMLVMAGLAGGVGQILLTSSYRNADASLIAPFDYASMLLAVVVGYTVFGEVPGPATWAGGAMVLVAGILIILRERKLGLERAQQRKATSNHP